MQDQDQDQEPGRPPRGRDPRRDPVQGNPQGVRPLGGGSFSLSAVTGPELIDWVHRNRADLQDEDVRFAGHSTLGGVLAGLEVLPPVEQRVLGHVVIHAAVHAAIGVPGVPGL